MGILKVFMGAYLSYGSSSFDTNDLIFSTQDDDDDDGITTRCRTRGVKVVALANFNIFF